VTRIYHYYKKFGYNDPGDGRASFRKVEQIVLACRAAILLTIATDLLDKMAKIRGRSE